MIRCVSCASPLHTLVFDVRADDTQESFSILRCDYCNLEQTYPQPKNLALYYAKHYYNGRHSFTKHHCVRRRISWINQFRHSSQNKLLDIGCGEGTFLLHAKQHGWETYGIEVNPARARASGLEVREHLEEYASLAPFDCITLWHSLEHMAAPEQLLSRIYQYLNPKGLLFIAVPNAGGWQSRIFKDKWLHRDVPRHLYHFTPRSLSVLLYEKQFFIEKQWHQEFEYDLLGWSQSMLNCISDTPNIFFTMLRGQDNKTGFVTKLLNWVGGITFSFLALPLLPLSAWARAGGTWVVACRPEPPKT